MRKVVIIGSGFSGLAAASVLAHEGFDVTVFEKNSMPGGRARRFTAGNFTFDMGPSWYWMPDVFERFFRQFRKEVSGYYHLVRLDPSYRVFFGKNDYLDIPAGIEGICGLFEKLEPGSSRALLRFVAEGKRKYEIGMGKLAYSPGLSLTELMSTDLIPALFRLHIFQSMSGYIRKLFREPRIIRLLEFPALFLGGAPAQIPALYSLLNYADMQLGTWYPERGMYQVADAMFRLATERGVTFRFNAAVEGLEMGAGAVNGVRVEQQTVPADYVVASADYHHVEQQLLPEHYRNYSPSYWNTRVLSPSALIFYIGLNKRVSGLAHHSLFFDQDPAAHAREIYDHPQWPTAPQFYVSCASKTDRCAAPPDGENLMILIPVAAGLRDHEQIREHYFAMVLSRLENMLGENLRSHIVFRRSYAQSDFLSDYNAFRGNAYGLANTWRQTAHFRPGILNKKVKNLFYTGQLTVPGPGVPPAIISGQIAARELISKHRRDTKRTTV